MADTRPSKDPAHRRQQREEERKRQFAKAGVLHMYQKGAQLKKILQTIETKIDEVPTKTAELVDKRLEARFGPCLDVSTMTPEQQKLAARKKIMDGQSELAAAKIQESIQKDVAKKAKEEQKEAAKKAKEEEIAQKRKEKEEQKEAAKKAKEDKQKRKAQEEQPKKKAKLADPVDKLIEFLEEPPQLDYDDLAEIIGKYGLGDLMKETDALLDKCFNTRLQAFNCILEREGYKVAEESSEED